MNLTYMDPKLDKEYRKESTEAVDWMLQIKSKDMSAEKRLEFENWLSKHPENRKQFNIINALWDSTQILKDDPFTAEVLNRRQIRAVCTPVEMNPVQTRGRSKIVKWAAIAATLLFAVAGVFLTHPYFGAEKFYYTATGEQQSIFLDDGSTIYLDSETNISVTFTPEKRHINMEKGRAVFSVAHDPARPFVVATGSINIRAIGTQFNVNKLNKTKVSVSVTEGKVQVTRQEGQSSLKSAPPIVPAAVEKNTEQLFRKGSSNKTQKSIEEKEASPVKIIAVGEKIIVDEQKNVYQINQIDLRYASSWREGRLYFNKAPLQDVLDEVNIYSRKKIVIGDNHLKDIKINMNFAIQDCKYFLRTLEDLIPIDYHAQSDNRIIITKRM